jgi:hypothetical protein
VQAAVRLGFERRRLMRASRKSNWGFFPSCSPSPRDRLVIDAKLIGYGRDPTKSRCRAQASRLVAPAAAASVMKLATLADVRALAY